MSFQGSSQLTVVGQINNSKNCLTHYLSSDPATGITGTGYLVGCGYGGRTASVGMRVGDIVMLQESSAGANPGRVTLHGVVASTANQASTAGSTGWAANYNVTVAAHAST